jgi:acetyl-CoA synthetase
VRIAVSPGSAPGWLNYEHFRQADEVFQPTAMTRSDELLLLYFTSGTTARPKLVSHTHASYPIGHLSTMYWLGLRPGDKHLNLSSPGWAKHAWSCFFAPWSAQAAVVAYNYNRFDARALLDQLVRCGVTTFCAPPTVWRFLIQQNLTGWPVVLREVVSAGEPLNPEVIAQVRQAWGLTIRDGFGQTETTALVGNTPGQSVRPGSMGRALPGCPIVLINEAGLQGEEGEICIDLREDPVPVMRDYLDDPSLTQQVKRGGYYHTGDVATVDEDGYLTYVGRVDDVFKSSDYRISPFELESVLIEHPAVVEAAVVPSPDHMRLAVAKAFIMLASGYEPSAEVAESLLLHVRARVSPFKRIRRIEFSTLPKTISGKIRRVELRAVELSRSNASSRRPCEYWEEDFPALKNLRGG